MASYRDRAFQAFYDSLPDKGGIGGADLLRKAWDAGRRYEAERVEIITRPPRSHNDACDGCGSPADAVRRRQVKSQT